MRIKILVLVMSATLLLSACQSKAAQTAERQEVKIQTSEHITQCPSTSQNETDFSDGDVGEDTSLKWPTELMGDILPVPGGIITSVDRASDIWGKDAADYITVVSFKGMDRKSCEMYVNKLRKLEFTDGVTEKGTETQIMYSGSINEVGIAVTFQYDYTADRGFVAYNPRLNNDFLDKWPSEKMGNIPDPACKLIDFKEEGEKGDKLSIVEFANMSEMSAKEYVVKLKNLGYSPETDISDGEIILFKGFDKNGKGVVFNFSVMYENGTISFGAENALSGC